MKSKLNTRKTPEGRATQLRKTESAHLNGEQHTKCLRRTILRVWCTPSLAPTTASMYLGVYLHKVHPLLLLLLLKLGLLLRRHVGCPQLPHSRACLQNSSHPTTEVGDTSAVGTKGEGPGGGVRGVAHGYK